MHWYKKNIGDYAKKAARLSMLQHGAYNQLMDACYDREQFPTRDQAIEWVWASSAEEIAAVDFVLSRFFTLENGVYLQQRIQDEVDQYLKRAEVNKRIALEREANRKKKSTNKHEPCTSGKQPVNEAPPNQEPVTSNQEPRTSSKDTLSNKSDSSGKAENQSSRVLSIFSYWAEVMGKSLSQCKLTPKREKAIKGRLKDGYTVEQIKKAIENCRADPFSMGKNDRQKPFNDIELICRSGEKLEGFIDGRVDLLTPTEQSAGSNWTEQNMGF